MENIIGEIEKTIFDEPLTDLAIDYLDIGLDMILDSEIIEAIPVVKTFVSLYKGTMSIKERFFAKKLMIFASEIYSGQVSEEEIQKRKIAIENNEKWVKKEIEDIAIFLDRFDFAYKAKLLAKLYILFLNKKIGLDRYINMISIIDKWQKYDNDLLEKLYIGYKEGNITGFMGGKHNAKTNYDGSMERLEALGILTIHYKVIDLVNELGSKFEVDDIKQIYGNCLYNLKRTLKLNYEGFILAEILFD